MKKNNKDIFDIDTSRQLTNNSVLCVSWCDADDVMNYGQMLQGMALMHVIRQITSGTIIYASYYKRNFKDKIRYFIKHVNPFNGHLFAYLKTKRTLKEWTRIHNIRLLQVSCVDKMDKLASNADVLVCGSDQIWHPQNLDKVFFLNFGSDNLWRFSYAASLPKTKIEEKFLKQFNEISNYLSRLNSISIREESSCKLISHLSKKEVVSVLDPTFLISKSVWENMSQTNNKNKYIFVYIPNGMDSIVESIVLSIKEKMGIDDAYAIITRGSNLFKSVKRLKFVSLSRFLSLIHDAACIVTTSFHAVVFSLIFHKEFYCYDVLNENRGEDIRLLDLLNTVNLKNRLIDNNLFSLQKEINYDRVDSLILSKKEDSLLFLQNNLVTIKNGNK